jgi:hypothetical protein
MRLDEAKLEELRRWGQALRETGDEGSVAAGRAILMLIEELEWLRLELRRAREQLEIGPRTGDTVALNLHERLQQSLDADSDQSLAAQPESAGDSDPRSWIETLRRRS